MESWIEAELAGLELGDERLHSRLGRLLDLLERRPASSLPEACGSWRELIGAYRFFFNPKVSLCGVISGHRQATVERMRGERVVLCVQDTTFLNFGDCPQTDGLGPHTYGHECGLSLHPVVAVSENGECLGTLWAKSWAKDPAQTGKVTYKKRPIQQKESWRWVEGLDQINQLPEDLPARVMVADREADIYDLMSRPRSAGVHWLIRAMHNRRTLEKEGMLEVLNRSNPLGEVELEVPRRPGIAARTARMEIRAGRIQIAVPASSSGGVQTPLELSVIRSREIGEGSLDWILLTDLPVNTLEQALEKVRWYRCRWKIEELFHVLKSGCQSEHLQLENRSRLEAALGVYLMVAWRLMHLKEQSRFHPDQDSSLLLSQWEWQTLAKLNKHPSAAAAPDLQQAVCWIAQLGGYLNRKHDPPPGIKTIWKGWRRLQDITLGVALASDTCV